MKRSLAAIVSFSLLLGAAVARADEPAAAPDPAEMMKAMAAYAAPGDAHKLLQPLEGKWTYTCKMWMVPGADPVEMTGTIERDWILGGRFLHESVSGGSFEGQPPFEGRGVIGYDNGEKKYVTGWICNMGTGLATSKGSYDASNKTFTFERECYCPIQQKVVPGRDIIRIESNDKNVMEVYELDENGDQRKVMELVSVREE